jgi:hypothetical protein
MGRADAPQKSSRTIVGSKLALTATVVGSVTVWLIDAMVDEARQKCAHLPSRLRSATSRGTAYLDVNACRTEQAETARVGCSGRLGGAVS